MQVQGDNRPRSARPRRTGRTYRVALCVAALLQLLNLVIFGPLSRGSSSPSAAAGAAPYPYTDVNPYGANTFLSKEVEDWKREKTVAMMSDAGIGWMKQQFPWSEIEPKPGRYWDDKYNQNSWDKYDRIVALAEQYGIRVIARLDNTPDWARGPNTTPQTPPTNPDDFADFVAAFVAHYKGRVQYLQIWNEPNLKVEWGGNKIDAAAYVDLLHRAYVRAKEVDPNIVILSAPLAQTLETGDRGLNELVFMQQMYNAGLASNCDIVMANGYGFDQPPDAPPDPTKLNLRRVELLRQVMERNGDGLKPIWLNEYGWNASPPNISTDSDPWSHVTAEQQATYTVEGIRYMRQHWPWVGVINIWYFRQVGDIPATTGEYYFRMVDPEFTTTLLYRDVQKATEAQRLAAPGRYGPLSPAISNRGRWSTIREPLTGQRALSSDHPNDTLTIHFKGNQVVLAGERGPQGGRLGVTLDGSTSALNSLPRDDKGRRYLDFHAANQEAVAMTVVAGLDPLGGPREHSLTLTVLPGPDGTSSLGAIVITALEVDYARSSTLFLMISVLAGLLAVGAVIPLFRAITRLRRRHDEQAHA
ncbi:MAG: cellulase family glycosylhydrolase [Thermomicrobiales bacterium]